MISLVKFSELKPVQRKLFDKLITQALTDPFIGGEWLSNLVEKVKTNSLRKEKFEEFFILVNDGELVGFFTPRLESGYWRAGSIFITQEYRGKGIMFDLLKHFFQNHSPAMAWIANSNTASKNLYLKLGFTKGKDYNLSTAEIDKGSWYEFKNNYKVATESMPTWVKW